jgi:hypothetical protein
LSPCTSIKSKMIKDPSIRPKTLKLVQQNTGNTQPYDQQYHSEGYSQNNVSQVTAKAPAHSYLLKHHSQYSIGKLWK